MEEKGSNMVAKTKLTQQQSSTLCTFFEQNPEVIRGYKKTPSCVIAVKNKWKKITPQLNSQGPAKNSKAWAKYLSDIKAKLKSKRVKWKLNSNGSGPVICNANVFNELQLRLLQVLGQNDLDTQEPQEFISNDCVEEASLSDNEIKVSTEEKPQNNTNYKSAYIKLEANTSLLSESQVTHLGQHHNDITDEFDTFGKNIAQQLRTLPLPVALETQEMLLAIVRKQRIKNLVACQIDPLAKC